MTRQAPARAAPCRERARLRPGWEPAPLLEVAETRMTQLERGCSASIEHGVEAARVRGVEEDQLRVTEPREEGGAETEVVERACRGVRDLTDVVDPCRVEP